LNNHLFVLPTLVHKNSNAIHKYPNKVLELDQDNLFLMEVVGNLVLKLLWLVLQRDVHLTIVHTLNDTSGSTHLPR
jgi:hypothetical protein